MKIIFSSLFVCLLFSALGQNKSYTDKEPVSIVLPTLDREAILRAIFKNGSIKKSEIVWRLSQNEPDILKEIISDDSLCHTKVDTFIVVGNKTFVVLRTDRYIKGKISDCNACAPVTGLAEFVKTEKGFELIRFSKGIFKEGAKGKRGALAILPLGEIPCLRETTIWESMGTYSIEVNYYSLTEYSNVFSLIKYESNESMFKKESPSFYSRTSKLINVKDYEFDVEVILLQYDPNLKKHTSTKGIDHFKYFPEKQKFIWDFK